MTDVLAVKQITREAVWRASGLNFLIISLEGKKKPAEFSGLSFRRVERIRLGPKEKSLNSLQAKTNFIYFFGEKRPPTFILATWMWAVLSARDSGIGAKESDPCFSRGLLPRTSGRSWRNPVRTLFA